MKLSDIAEFITDKISSSSISLDSYVTTDSLLQNKRGRELAQNLPPMQCALTHYRQGDVLVANIRPYLKKVWYADSEGGCSSDVLVFRAKNGHYPSFLYAILMQDAFFDYAMLGAKGSKMPRGDKNQIMRYELPTFTSVEEENIGNIMVDIISKINVNRQINDNLEAMAKQLYDYWFVQFDFPNEEGKPYKSSGGAMVWNEKLKREIPQGWSNGVLSDVANITMGQSPDGSSYNEDGEGIIFYQGSTDFGLRFPDIRQYTTSPSRYANKGDILMSVRAPVGALNIANNDCCIGRGLSALSSKIGSMTHLYYLMNDFRLKFEGMNSAGTTFGSITKDELFSLPVIIPTKSVISEFEQVCEPIFDKQMIIGEEINALTKQRDDLLPLLMNGQATVNYHLSALFLFSLILYRDQYKFCPMKETIIQTVLDGMRAVLTENQLELLTDVTRKALSECEITPKLAEEEQRNKENAELLGAFISSKKVEGCSDKTIHYYKSSIEKLIATVKKNVCDISTNDIRCYLADQQEQRGLSKVTIDNLRRIYSSFFSWLEDEDYITKSPVRRIHKVRTDALVKEVLTDENIEVLRDSCHELRDIAMIDLLLSTGMRVGELVKINREDIDFQERQCIVFGKGNKEREVYFNARTKIHLKKYLEQRTDTNPALFVSLHEPHTRLTISGVEVRLRQLGKRVNLNKVHPHKFRRTLATMAIDKGMPIEQVQKMLGHVKIDTTLHYAMVNQTNVKIAHRKFLN